ncbi:MAG: hypothetical protein EOP56_09390 [Sphingobacteriales bacterium]|nr:MAG: hypothetical protein EOP56_09390 [Sphingobacteriales bacterium]
MPYNIDYTELVYDTLPPDKRTTRHAKWLIALVSPLTWLKDLFFTDYLQGTTYAAYNPLTTYAKGDRVTLTKAVYESLQNSNTGNGVLANLGVWWIKVQDNYLGVDERVQYNGHKLILEYALNKWFGGTFRQPPLESDIYIENIAQSDLSFLVAATDNMSSPVGFTDSFGYVKGTNAGVDELPEFNFIIYVPTAIYSLFTDPETIISEYAKQYVPVGLTFKIEEY